MALTLMPSSQLKSTSRTKQKQGPCRTWSLDKPGVVLDEKAALMQSVAMSLSVERYRHSIFSWGYGSELTGLLGKDMARIEAEAPDMIKACLMVDDRIDDVNQFTFRRQDDGVVIAFHVVGTWGTFESEVAL